MFQPARPTGERCQRRVADSDEAKNQWDTSVDGFRDEAAALFAGEFDDAMSEPEQADAFAQLQRMMRKAADAVLDFSGDRPEAAVMSREDFVIELRPKPMAKATFGRKPRVLRLYFAEPLSPPDKLLGLHIGTKEGADEAGEQNVSIDIAAKRAHEWCAA